MTRAENTQITAARLRELLHYDKSTGIFTWNVARYCVRATASAGALHPDGYIHIKVDGRTYRAHRLAWLYVHGVWPTLQIDHVNRTRTDNRVENLREVNNSQNQQNASLSPRNTSGFRGVSWQKSSQRWHAYIKVNGKRKHLGYFEDAAAAHDARVKAAELMHTHRPVDCHD